MLGEASLKGVVGRKTGVVAGDIVVVAAMPVVGPDEKSVAAVAQAVAGDPVVVRILLQQNSGRVGGIAPEPAGIADAMIGLVVPNTFKLASVATVPAATEANLKVYAPSGLIASAGGIWTTCQSGSRHSGEGRNPWSVCNLMLLGHWVSPV